MAFCGAKPEEGIRAGVWVGRRRWLDEDAEADSDGDDDNDDEEMDLVGQEPMH